MASSGHNELNCADHSTKGQDYLIDIHVNIHINEQKLSNIAFDWLAAQPPANQKTS